VKQRKAIDTRLTVSQRQQAAHLKSRLLVALSTAR
jgi:hypothetical protein